MSSSKVDNIHQAPLADPELKISAKRRRKEKEGKVVDKERLQCEFIIPKKNRRCPLTCKKDVQYCAEHLKQTQNDIRVTCTVDPRHTVWQKDLKSHVKKCGAKAVESKQVSWFKENHNCVLPSKVDDQDTQIDYSKWIPKVESIYSNFRDLELIQLEHDGVKERVEELGNPKHAVQQSSLISHLDNKNLLSNELTYVEFGCGRAELSRYIAKSVIHKTGSAADFILIDRSPTRMKLDSKMIQDAEERKLKTKIHRVKIDIKDLYLDNIVETDFANEKGFVGVSKHLCGAATDLTIQCILANSKFNSRFTGMIVAMCCRHCCDYNMLSQDSIEYLKKFGVEKEGFKHFMKFASWAVNGRRPGMKDEDGTDHVSGLSIKQREDLGLKARRIIDESRRYALEQKGYKVQLCHYVPKEISLENTCMIVNK
ncbi:tRNA guanosine-2'-O-methyltransferase TRM13 [Wickerhamomyces ciferrii]|uniref:tRNA:m(4)X modification enzyme TRM13 n=1 Tax=Wickerhamomyces ciferrii (strain ATCC 14091 / BCRC 22168 / CBS 111 / JCM 3599 / NBRC 0793 / NRRL Y-1031 F-60-10) TaxID=1206466 RepID=K0KT07_WICCF|nr:tRNA guanosine-2'-O-methyltransferase TRM13 [Wickerhamomyces ciferrii]CCH46266.1 tRNA guanosine-2'-O-methyltransferase TRM13 [Wickerhamomyces ciferrii]